MAQHPDLTLPNRVPGMEQYHNRPEQILPFAFYTLCELDSKRFEEYRQICEKSHDHNIVKLPPQAHFIGDSLRSILSYHVQLARGGEFDPTYIIVCVYRNATSVVVVTLHDDDLECKPDLLWTKTEDSGLLLVNLQISNTDWSEAKEEDISGPTWPSGRGGENASCGENDDKDDGDKDDDGSLDLIDYGPPPPVGFHIQLYTLPDVDENTLIRYIEPGVIQFQRTDQSNWACKIYRLSSDANGDPIRYAANLYPHQCARHPSLAKNYFIVADEPNFLEEGVVIAHVDWDGRVLGKTSKQLLDIGQGLSVRTHRAEVLETGRFAAVATLCMFVQGYQKWEPEAKQFAVYYSSSSEANIKLAMEIDTSWVKRGHGKARVVFGGSILPDEIERDGGYWPALVRKHVACCKEHRFIPSFVQSYFILCDNQNVSADNEVQLIRLDWNSNRQWVENVAQEYRGKVSTIKELASKAHEVLTNVVNGKLEWQGKMLVQEPESC